MCLCRCSKSCLLDGMRMIPYRMYNCMYDHDDSSSRAYAIHIFRNSSRTSCGYPSLLDTLNTRGSTNVANK